MPRSALSSTGKGEQLLTMRCTAAIPGAQLPFHLTAGLCLLLHKLQVSFTMCSAPASEFCLTNQLNGFPKSSEFSMPDSAPVARTFMAAVSFALGSHGGKKKKATMDPVPKVEIFFFILQTRLKIGGE
ncbi:uncharacterized protein LOC121360444 isoform X1 [Pyrgilauda ruficollis]|uniref:uncharacterized protein LOC121360444 isoform X1 n=1 Tax=Pyrgilauda ruficollis TaxID=221976 RepID=UPI001B8862ED|nr:uncharacterized protein LOC121360444 isoform X1 [Pyrgilauda ruficollis]